MGVPCKVGKVTEDNVCFSKAEDVVNKTTSNEVYACSEISTPHQSFQILVFPRERANKSGSGKCAAAIADHAVKDVII